MNECSEIPFHLSQVIERNFEFLLQYVKNIDKDVLYSLLLSEMDNPRGLETIMCDMLGIPNATDLIRQFQSSTCNTETEAMDESMELAVAIDSSKKYFKQISEMFPDADKIFLERECQKLENDEDCSRFINTVMLNGAYSKNNLESSSSSSGKNEGNRTDAKSHFKRCDIVYSSDEENTSSCVMQYEKQKTEKRKVPNGFHSILDLPSTSKGFIDVEEIDDRPGPSGLCHFYNMNNITQANGNDVVLDSDKDLPINSVHQAQSSSITGGETSKQEKAPNSHSLSVDNKRTSTIANGEHSSFHSGSVHNDSFPNNHKNSYPVGWTVESIDSGSSSNAAKDEIILIDDDDDDDDDSVKIPNAADNSSNPNNTVQDQNMEQQTEGKLSEWVAQHTAELIRLFPQADPSYLRDECDKCNGSLAALNEFVFSKLERNDMPSRADYENRKEMEELQHRYTTSFSIEDFLKVIPDPWSYFKNKKRNCSAYKFHSLTFLRSKFRKLYPRVISITMRRNDNNLYLAYLDLKKISHVQKLNHKGQLKYIGAMPKTINIQFLQEVAFIKNEKKIKKFIEEREAERKKKFEEAKQAGSLLECQCCFDSEVMVEDTVYCPNDHCFCKTCVTKYVEVGMGQAKYQFPCLADCGENYTLTTLQNALKPELFSKVIKAIQLEEVKAAGIEDLVQCPFCNYATIMPPEQKIMTCLNPECQKESCRLCKELNHVPLKCDEIEKSEEVKMRTYIENKMTEALVRTCYKCGKGFVKVDGCNKTVCSCGAKMCYVCRKPVDCYSHFNGQGGTDYTKCPLYSTNNELHVDAVKRVAEEAKAEMLKANPEKMLKHDPTTVLPERTDEEPVPGMNGRRVFYVAEAVFRENEERLARIRRMQRQLDEQRMILRRRVELLLRQDGIFLTYPRNN